MSAISFYTSIFVAHIANGVVGVPILNNSPNTWQVYPNPTKDDITIRFEDGFYRSISILSEEGKVIQTTHSNNDQLQLSLRALPAGTYIISISDNNNNIDSKKIIKL